MCVYIFLYFTKYNYRSQMRHLHAVPAVFFICLLKHWVKKTFHFFFSFLLFAFKIQLTGNSTYPEASLVICSVFKSLSLTNCPHLLNLLYNTDCSLSPLRVTPAPNVSKRILNAWFRTNKHNLTCNICKEGVATHSLFPPKWQQSVAHVLFFILTNIWEV